MVGFCYSYLKFHEKYHTRLGLSHFNSWQLFGEHPVLGVFYENAMDIILMSVTLLNISGVFSNAARNNVDLMFACVSTSIHASQCTLKGIHFKYRRSFFLSHLQELEKIFARTDFIRKCQKNGAPTFQKYFFQKSEFVRVWQFAHFIIELFTHFFYFGGHFWVTAYLDAVSRRLPMVCYFPFDEKPLPQFIFFSALLFIGFCVMSSRMVSIDYYILDILVLQYSHMEFMGDTLKEILSYKPPAQRNFMLRSWIKLHQQSLRLLFCSYLHLFHFSRIIKSFQHTISGYLAIEYAYMVLHTCIPVFIVTSLPTWNMVTKVGVVIIAITGQGTFLLLAQAGQALEKSISQLGSFLYDECLLDDNTSTETFLMVQNIHSVPFYYRFFAIPLRLTTFVNILRLTMSYYLLLHDIQDKTAEIDS